MLPSDSCPGISASASRAGGNFGARAAVVRLMTLGDLPWLLLPLSGVSGDLPPDESIYGGKPGKASGSKPLLVGDASRSRLASLASWRRDITFSNTNYWVGIFDKSSFLAYYWSDCVFWKLLSKLPIKSDVSVSACTSLLLGLIAFGLPSTLSRSAFSWVAYTSYCCD